MVSVVFIGAEEVLHRRRCSLRSPPSWWRKSGQGYLLRKGSDPDQSRAAGASASRPVLPAFSGEASEGHCRREQALPPPLSPGGGMSAWRKSKNLLLAMRLL